MITIVRDIVRAGLVLVVLAVGLELLQAHREAAADPRPWQPAPTAAAPPPAWQPAQTVVVPPPQPIRRVGRSIVDLAESLLGVVR
jgi:hypothetical protein